VRLPETVGQAEIPGSTGDPAEVRFGGPEEKKAFCGDREGHSAQRRRIVRHLGTEDLG